MAIEIRVDDEEVLRALSQLVSRLENLSPVMRERCVNLPERSSFGIRFGNTGKRHGEFEQ